MACALQSPGAIEDPGHRGQGTGAPARSHLRRSAGVRLVAAAVGGEPVVSLTIPPHHAFTVRSHTRARIPALTTQNHDRNSSALRALPSPLAALVYRL